MVAAANLNALHGSKNAWYHPGPGKLGPSALVKGET